jgi:hypothetical protein
VCVCVRVHIYREYCVFTTSKDTSSKDTDNMWSGGLVCVCVRVHIYREIICGVEFWFVCACVHI